MKKNNLDERQEQKLLQKIEKTKTTKQLEAKKPRKKKTSPEETTCTAPPSTA